MAPGKPRATFRDDTGGFEIVIPARRNVFLTGFLSIWMVGWTFGWVSAFSELSSGRDGAPVDAFLAIWITVWTFGGAAAGVVLAWSIAGRERIRLGRGTLTISRKAFNVGPSREYDLSHVSRLRVASDAYNPFDFGSSLRFWGLGGGPLAFDYGASTVRFGASVDEGEAHELREEILRRHPSAGEPAA